MRIINKNPVEAICVFMGRVADSHLKETEESYGLSVCYGNPFCKGFQYHCERIIRKNGWEGNRKQFIDILCTAVDRFKSQWWEYAN